MNAILFARAMRSRGWRSAWIKRGIVHFGARFGNGLGVTIAIATEQLLAAAVAPAQLAELITRMEAAKCGADLRQRAAAC